MFMYCVVDVAGVGVAVCPGPGARRALVVRTVGERGWWAEQSTKGTCCIVVCIYHTFDNNFGIKNDFTKYLKERYL